MSRAPAALGALPRVGLAVLPTPLQPVPRLSAELGVEVWVKRDDMTGLGLGGNKARKLELLAGEALARGCDMLVTGGGPTSNHAQLTAAAAARLGLECLLVMYGKEPEPGAEPFNLWLARQMGASAVFTSDDDRESVDREISARLAELEAAGRRPFGIPRGGASPLGSAGYVEAAFELRDQLEERGVRAARVFLATGSCGTQAGLLLGSLLAQATWEVAGVTVSRPAGECRARISDLAAACARLLGVEPAEGISRPTVLEGFLGPGYGRPSQAGREAAALAARTEGLALDQTYTAKAMAALREEVRQGRLRGPVVFLHTGGTGGLLGSRTHA